MNDTPPNVDELISRHFDGALAPAEHQRLTDVLNTDRQARLDFAATARLHAGLEALAPPLPPARKRSVARWMLAGAAAAVCLGGGFLFWNPEGIVRNRVTLQDMDGRPEGTPEKPKPPGLTKRLVKTPASALAAGLAPEELRELLSRYYVNVSPHGLTVPQALAQLEQEIANLNVLNRPELDLQKFVAAESGVEGTEDPVVFSPQPAPMTAKDYLMTCGLFRRVVDNSGGATLFPQAFVPAPRNSDAGPEIREIPVPPDFLSISGDGPPYPEGNAAAAKMARSYGIRLEEDESATFSSNPSTLTVSARPGKLDQLQHRIEQFSRTAALQVFVTSHYLKLPRALLPSGFDEASGMILQDAEYVRFRSGMTTDSRCAMHQAPSVIVRANQQSMIEVHQELPRMKDWVGLSQKVLVVPAGELIRVEGLVDFGILAGVSLPAGLAGLGLNPRRDPVPDGLPQHYQTEYELWLPDRATGLFVAEAPADPGFLTLVCVTATLIDPSGQPFHPDIPAGIPVPGKPGFVYSPHALDRGMLDFTGSPSGSEVWCPHTGKAFLLP